jgi:hypothetical protein
LDKIFLTPFSVASVNEDGLQPGFVLTSPIRPVQVARRFEAQVGELMKMLEDNRRREPKTDCDIPRNSDSGFKGILPLGGDSGNVKLIIRGSLRRTSWLLVSLVSCTW